MYWVHAVRYRAQPKAFAVLFRCESFHCAHILSARYVWLGSGSANLKSYTAHLALHTADQPSSLAKGDIWARKQMEGGTRIGVTMLES
mgnify:CR=1 FL=1